MISSSPIVSVCIPTYKGAATIGAAIESVLGQSFANFELIVIDDGSPDTTRAIVEKFTDPRIKYLRNERNLGPQGNWNRCLDVARGKYFKLLPHDDLLYPECLARQVAALDSDLDEQIALTFSARDVIGPSGKVLTRRGYPGALDGRIASNDILRACVRRGTNLIGEPGAVLMRKSLADRVGKFDGTNPYVIDLDFWFRLLAHGAAWYNPAPLAAFRVSRQQWSVVIGTGQSNDFRNFINRTAAMHVIPLNSVDRFFGKITPTLNNVMRLIFYRFYLR